MITRALLLGVCMLDGADAFLWRSHASSRYSLQRPARRRRDSARLVRAALASAPSEDEEGLMVTIARVRRPLGVILEEREDGRGVEVLDFDPSGNAAGEDVLVGDRVLMVGSENCAEDDFDTVAGRIGSSAGDRVELTLGRRVGTVRIIWPNGAQSGALPGEPLQELALKARYPVKYACTSGSCGTCEHRLRTPGDEIRYTRLCVARVPKGKEVAQILPGDRF
jgi:ferredoxin